MYFVIWDDINLAKISLNDVTADEVEEITNRATSTIISRSSGRQMLVGWTSSGRRLVVPFDWVDQYRTTIRPVTAYEPEEA